MIYGHIFNDYGKLKVCYRRWTKFQDAEDEEKISKNLIATLDDPTGDSFSLAKRVADYAAENGLKIDCFSISKSDATVLAHIAELTEKDEIEMLKSSVRNLAAHLESAMRANRELSRQAKKAIAALEEQIYTSENLLYCSEIQYAIHEIAEEELGCEHLINATGIYWERRKRTDC